MNVTLHTLHTRHNVRRLGTVLCFLKACAAPVSQDPTNFGTIYRNRHTYIIHSEPSGSSVAVVHKLEDIISIQCCIPAAIMSRAFLECTKLLYVQMRSDLLLERRPWSCMVVSGSRVILLIEFWSVLGIELNSGFIRLRLIQPSNERTPCLGSVPQVLRKTGLLTSDPRLRDFVHQLSESTQDSIGPVMMDKALFSK